MMLVHKSQVDSEQSSQLAKHVGTWSDINGLGFMHSVSLKFHGPVLLSMELLPFSVYQSFSPFQRKNLRCMVPAVTSLAN